MTKQSNIQKINALAELERAGYSYEPRGNDEIQLLCPVHDDTTPSVSLNVKKNLWKCHSAECGATGDIISFLAYVSNVERRTILADLKDRYNLDLIKTINPDTIEKYHQRILDDSPLKSALYDRGITDDLIRSARLGLDSGRITIPVYDIDGRVINVRKYLPGAPGPQKMRNSKGFSSLELYQIDQLKYSVIWICGGEMKALVAKSLLNSENIGALAVTGGEGSWDDKFTKKFEGKIVYVCMDIDNGGKAAAKKVAAHIAHTAQSVYTITLPLNTDKFPKGDINDWVSKEKATTKDFLEVMDTARPFSAPDQGEAEEAKIETVEMRLVDTIKAENVDKRIQFDAIISALDTTPYIIPKTIQVACTRAEKNCAFCPIHAKPQDENTGKSTIAIKPTSRGILDLLQRGPHSRLHR